MIDCFFIGNNSVPFRVLKPILKFLRFLPLEKLYRLTGKNSFIYMFHRSMNYNWLEYQKKLYTIPEILARANMKDQGSPNILADAIVDNDGMSLTIAYLASFLQRKGFTFDFVNKFRGEKAALAAKLRSTEILTIAIPTTLYVSYLQIVEIIRFIKKYNRKVKIIVGGPFILTQAQNSSHQDFLKFLKKINADFYVVSQEGETALTEILRSLKNNQSLDKIKNIIYKHGKQYLVNPTQPEDNNLEENPVNWGLFTERLGPMAVVRTAKSCPYKCAFCSFPELGGKYKNVSVEVVEQELTMLHNTGKIEKIWFADDTLNVPPERFKNMLRIMIKNNYRFQWSSYLRCQHLDRETVELMKESGYNLAFLGIDSGNQQILNNMNKNVTVDSLQAGLRLLNEYEIDSLCSFIIGFPGETAETVQDTLRFVEENRPTFCVFNIWYAMPGTPIYQKKNEFKIKGRDYLWSHATMDSKTAFDLTDNLYLSLKNSLYIPAYSSFPLLYTLADMKALRNFVAVFSDEMKQKLANPKQHGVSDEAWKQLMKTARY